MFEIIRNPAELGCNFVDDISPRQTDRFEINYEEERLLSEIERISEDLNFLNKRYSASAYRGFLVPKQFSESGKVSYFQYDSVSFEGEFMTYSVVKIGRIIGAMSVRALCATFSNSILYSNFELLPDDHLLHIPVLAVYRMDLAA